jgi:hypothetical protein
MIKMEIQPAVHLQHINHGHLSVASVIQQQHHQQHQHQQILHGGGLSHHHLSSNLMHQHQHHDIHHHAQHHQQLSGGGDLSSPVSIGGSNSGKKFTIYLHAMCKLSWRSKKFTLSLSHRNFARGLREKKYQFLIFMNEYLN